MSDVPQFLEEDMREVGVVISKFLEQIEVELVLLTAHGGFLITHFGEADGCDPTTLGALASNSYEANRAIAAMIGEKGFDSMYQQGETRRSMFVQSIDGYNLVVVIFPISVAVGAVKFYCSQARDQIAAIFAKARARTPGEGLDLTLMNVEDSEAIFRRK